MPQTNLVKERLSHHFLGLIASRGGFLLAKPPEDFGVDITIRRVGGTLRQNGKHRELITGEQVDLQLKSTTLSSLRAVEGGYMYDLAAQNYNDLIDRRGTSIPLILVVLALPDDDTEWLSVAPHEVTARRCCFWFRPSPEAMATSNTESQAILLRGDHTVGLETIHSWFTAPFMASEAL